MSFWRKDVIDFALDRETLHHIEEQKAWIAREPANPRPYHHLALLFRMQGRQDEALGLLLEAVRLNHEFAPAHAVLAGIYALQRDSASAWRHARRALALGEPGAVELLSRHQVPDTESSDS